MRTTQRSLLRKGNGLQSSTPGKLKRWRKFIRNRLTRWSPKTKRYSQRFSYYHLLEKISYLLDIFFITFFCTLKKSLGETDLYRHVNLHAEKNFASLKAGLREGCSYQSVSFYYSLILIPKQRPWHTNIISTQRSSIIYIGFMVA